MAGGTRLILLAAAALAQAPAETGDDWSACAMGDAEAAIAACSTVIASPSTASRQASAYYNRGIAWRARSQQDRANRDDAALDRAIADYDAALRLKPDSPEAFVNRGVARFDKGQYDLAVADATRAIDLRPDLAEAYNNRALAWYRQGRYDRAQPDFDKTIRLRKNYGNALILRPLPPIGGSPRVETPDEP